MRRVKRFVKTKKRETEAQIAKQGKRNGKPPDELLTHMLEGRLEAYKLLAHYLDRLEEEDVLLNGSASAFSPQG
jgi:hypothetical protein